MHYLDYAAFGPMSSDVRDFVLEWIKFANHHGPRSQEVLSMLHGNALQQLSRATDLEWHGLQHGLECIAELLGDSAFIDGLAFAHNTTQSFVGSVLAAHAALLAVKPYGPIILELLDDAHPTILRAARQLARILKIDLCVTRVDDWWDGNDCDYWPPMRRSRRAHVITVLTHVNWATGRVADLSTLPPCRNVRSRRIIVDGAHGFACIDLANVVDWEAIFCYVTGGHKWLCGPIPLGIAYYPQSDDLMRFAQAAGRDYLCAPMLNRGIANVESLQSSGSVDKIVGACAAAHEHISHGIKRITAKQGRQRQCLLSMLAEAALPYDVWEERHAQAPAIVLLKPRQEDVALQRVKEALEADSRTFVSIVRWSDIDCLRISIGKFVREADIEAVIGGLRSWHASRSRQAIDTHGERR